MASPTLHASAAAGMVLAMVCFNPTQPAAQSFEIATQQTQRRITFNARPLDETGWRVLSQLEASTRTRARACGPANA